MRANQQGLRPAPNAGVLSGARGGRGHAPTSRVSDLPPMRGCSAAPEGAGVTRQPAGSQTCPQCGGAQRRQRGQGSRANQQGLRPAPNAGVLSGARGGRGHAPTSRVSDLPPMRGCSAAPEGAGVTRQPAGSQTCPQCGGAQRRQRGQGSRANQQGLRPAPNAGVLSGARGGRGHAPTSRVSDLPRRRGRSLLTVPSGATPA